jgi:hypothetical protein
MAACAFFSTGAALKARKTITMSKAIENNIITYQYGVSVLFRSTADSLDCF